MLYKQYKQVDNIRLFYVCFIRVPKTLIVIRSLSSYNVVSGA